MSETLELTTFEPLTLWQEDSPASQSATPASASGGTMFAGSGPSSPASFASFDPATSSWRTSPSSASGDSTKSRVIWPRSGMTRNGTAYQLAPSAPRTIATDSSLWPTPLASNTKAVHMRTGGRPPRSYLWPTPTRSDGTGGPGNSGRQGGLNLRTAVRLWKTPTAAPASHGGGGGELQKQVKSSAGEPGPLNPAWIEWLMGYPRGWTVLQDSGTRSSRKSSSTSAGGSSRRTKRVAKTTDQHEGERE